MAEWLMLDALNPPNPAALVNDCRSVGAKAVALYVLRRNAVGGMLGVGTWTSAHVAACNDAGIATLPIIVPGSNPDAGDALHAIGAAKQYGVRTRAMVADIETLSFPSFAWVQSYGGSVRAAGWKALRYGDVGPLANYPALDGDWISHGKIPVRDGVIFPMPALPSGCVADQYAVNCVINGHQYDASVIDSSVFGATVARSNVTTGGAMSFVEVYCPWIPGRVDTFLIEPFHGRVMRQFVGGGAGAEDNLPKTLNDWWEVGATPIGGFEPLTLNAITDDLQRWIVTAVARLDDSSGQPYELVLRIDGGYDQNWSPVGPPVALPSRSTTTSTDVELRKLLRGIPEE